MRTRRQPPTIGDQIHDARSWLERLVGTHSATRAMDWTSRWLAEDPSLRLHELRDEPSVATFAGEVALTIEAIDDVAPLALEPAPHGFWAQGVAGRTRVRAFGATPREALRALRRGIEHERAARPS